jgi:acetyl esterase/lipase
VIVAPGGGYHILAEDLEGEEVADWLTRIGVTAVLLEYRVPRRPDQPKTEPPAGALQDAQRAVGLVRARASEWGVDPSRIGMLGFSAGGHLTAWASSNWEKRSYEPRDASDDMSCRPDFAVLIYPGYLQKSGRSTDLHPTIVVTPKSPPTFLAHAADDPVSHENSVLYHMAMRRAGVPSELHIYGSGGHGFGLRASSNPCSTWPARCEEWMKSRGLLEPLK